MDMWDGKILSDIEDLQIEFMEAYTVNKSITTKEYSDLLSQLNQKVPNMTKENMKIVFENLDALEPEPDQKGVIKRDLYQYVYESLAKGKEPSYNDINDQLKGLKVKRARHLLGTILNIMPEEKLSTGGRFPTSKF